MQVNKEQAIANAQQNLELFQNAETTSREINVANVSSNVEALVDHAVTNAPCPVVTVKVAPADRIEPLQAFISKAQVLSTDENGAIAITDVEYERYVASQAASVSEQTAKLVLRS